MMQLEQNKYVFGGVCSFYKLLSKAAIYDFIFSCYHSEK